MPLASSSRLSLDLLAVMLLSVMVTPSAASVPPATGLNVRVVNVPAAGVVPPITVLSTVPSFMSTLDICTDPVPLPASTKSSFERITFITLSVRFTLESIVRLETFTTPVPPGVRFRSAFELVAIMLSLKVRLSIVVVPAKELAPETVRVESVVAPVTPRVELTVVAGNSVAPALNDPATVTPSLMLIVDESGACMLAPENPMPSMIT